MGGNATAAQEKVIWLATRTAADRVRNGKLTR